MEKTMSSLSLSAVLPKRPKPTGILIGNSKTVLTNFYQLTRPPTRIKIYVYSVTFSPEIPPDDRRRKYGIMRRVVSQITSKGVMPFSTFMDNMLFSSTPITEMEIPNAKWKDGTVYVINIKRHYDIDMTEFSEDNEKNREMLRVLTAEMKDKMRRLKYQQINRGSAFFDRAASGKFRDFWEIYRGFYVPCKVIETGVAVQIALRTKLVSRLTVLDTLLELREKYGEEFWAAAEEEIVGRSVRANYGNFRYWRVDGINFEKTPLSTFEWEGKGTTPFVKYYFEMYKLNITNTTQPLLVNIGTRDKKVTYLIPELISLTGFSDSEARRYRKDLNQFTYISDEDRIARASSLAGEIAKCPSLLGSSVSVNPMAVESTLINAPQIILGAGTKATLTEPDREFSVKGRIYEPAKFEKGKWLFIYEESDLDAAGQILECMREASKSLGIEVQEPRFQTFSSTSWRAQLQEIFAKAQSELKVDFTVTLMPTKLSKREKDDCYKLIKKSAYKDSPISNQVVRSEILSKNYMSKISKLLIGMNAKKGGAPWRALMFKMETPIIMGVDICHSKERGVNKSYLGFCATMDSSFTVLYSLAYPIAPGQELMDGLKHCVYSALAHFLERYKYKEIPKLLIIYRDGVSESQFQAVIESEVKQITDYIVNVREKLGLPADVWDPKIIYVVVNKRVNTRLFDQTTQVPTEVRSTGRPMGPIKGYSTARSGTLVTKGITSRRYDFYLIAQKITQGSAIPTHYHVLYDSSTLDPEKLYLLTYRLCFLYFNWMGGIRVPAPCQYAHRQAFTAANYVGDTPSSALASKLYYL